MEEYTIKIAGKGLIINVERMQNRRNLTQNLWRVTLKNGSTTSVVFIPTKRDTKITNKWKNDLIPGNTLIFMGFLDVERPILTSVNVVRQAVQKTMEFNLHVKEIKEAS